MKIGLAQMHSTIGDFDKNVETILRYARRAGGEGVGLLVYPELCVCGYPPKDLVLHEDFVAQNLRAVKTIASLLPKGLAVLVGYVAESPYRTGKPVQNVVSCVLNGSVAHTQAKTLLPTYDVFDEARIFEAARSYRCVTVGKVKIASLICEDAWVDTDLAEQRYEKNPLQELAKLSPDILVVSSASPFHVGKPTLREEIMQRISRRYRVATVFINAVGAHDSLVFDGCSSAFDAEGRVVLRLAGFEEDYSVCSFPPTPSRSIRKMAHPHADLTQALCSGIRDFAEKTGFSDVHLGLSGGVDSALVATLAVEALGAEHVQGVLMPSPYSSKGSVEDALELAQNLAIRSISIPIHEVFDSFLETLRIDPDSAGTSAENIQARIRGTLLMAIANRENSMLLATGNKSELATGYCTLYGDMAGALAVVGDLFKTEVYALSRYLNSISQRIPQAILDKAPSAELRPGQKDQDSLPPYELLDEILRLHIVERKGADAIVRAGFEKDTVHKTLTLVQRAEFKRFQAPPVLRISPLAFGQGRDLPIARAYSLQ